MQNEKDFVSNKQEQREAEKVKFKDFLSGDVLTRKSVLRYWRFVLFLALLSMLYVANQHVLQSKRREYRVMKKEVEKLRFKSMELRAELMKYSRQSQVIKRVNDRGLGLEISSNPPVVLEQE